MRQGEKHKEMRQEKALSEKLRRIQRLGAGCSALGRGGIALEIVLVLAAWVLRPGEKFLAALAMLFVLSGGCALLGIALRGKAKALLQEQLNGFFHSALEQTFGPALQLEELQLCPERVREMQLLEGQWTDCSIREFHAGCYREIPFSAANLCLEKIYTTGSAAERLRHRDPVFRGILLSLRATQPVEQQQLEAAAQSVGGTLAGACQSGGVLTLAIGTDHRFAAVPENMDLSDLDAVRDSFTRSVQRLKLPLDCLLQSLPDETTEERSRL